MTVDPEKVIARAALCLRDDPTFAKSPRAEQEEEARGALAAEGGDPADPLEVALAIEKALSGEPLGGVAALPEKPVARHVAFNRFMTSGERVPVPPLESCREGKDGETPGTALCNAPVGATGRCNDCGAYRFAPVSDVPPAPSLSPPPAPIVTALDLAPTIDDGETHLVRDTKHVTGWPDHFIADVLKVSRPLVQAYVGGRRPERLGTDQALNLRAALERQIEEMQRIVERITRPGGS